MNKLNIYLGNNTLNLFKEVLKKIKPFLDNMTVENFVVVPDRLSLITEQQIFKLLNIDAYFNISVMGISKFAHKIINDSGLNLVECSSLESKLILLKAIQNVSGDFKCFSKNYTFGFIDEMYAKIEQIKSSRVDIEELILGIDGGNKLKFEDIKLIYNEYERLRGEKLDSGALLELFTNSCGQSELLKNCNVFFVGFDSMTRQGVLVVKNVILNAKSVYIGITVPDNQENFKIYDKTFYDSIVKMCEESQFECEKKWIKENYLNKDAIPIMKNLFSRNTIFDSNNYIKLYRCFDTMGEIDLAVKSINYILKKENLNFKDISICAPTTYHEILKSKLIALGIDAYSDSKIQLSNLEPIKFIIDYLKFLNEKNSNDLTALISNEFFNMEKKQKETLLTLIKKYTSLNSILKYEKNLSEEIVKIISNLQIEVLINNNDSIENYAKIIEKFVKNQNLIDKIEYFCTFAREIGEVQIEKTYRQIPQKLQTILDQLVNSNIVGNIAFSDFLELCNKAFMDVGILGVPSKVNQIFIGDYKSFYNDTKILYVMGMNEGLSPELLYDTGLITDKEILLQKESSRLEPTTRMINKRNKFKLFEVILSAQDKCYLYYHTKDEDNKVSQPSEFITEIEQVFNIKPIEAMALQLFDESKLELNKICLNYMDIYNANLNCEATDPSPSNLLLKGALIDDGKYFIPTKSKFKFKHFKDLFLKNNKVSVSLAEKFYNCPRSAFLSYGLKLQEPEREDTKANIIGMFIHEVGERFVKENIKNLGYLEEDKLEINTKLICKSILQNEKYYTLNLDENKFLLKMLTMECIRFCKFLNQEQSVSYFKPVYEEKYFGTNSDFKPIEIEIDGEKFTISGIVDRIDVFDDNFRIIDYKTGNTTNKNGKENLYYGKKIQLFVYAKAISQNLDKKLFGVFYLPIQNSFKGVGDQCYSLSGFFINSYFFARYCDKNFGVSNPKSNILDVTLQISKKTEEIKLRKKNNLLSSEEINAYCELATQMVKNATANLLGGYIKCSPLKNACEFCEFKDICDMSKNQSIKREENFNVTTEKILGLVNNGEQVI